MNRMVLTVTLCVRLNKERGKNNILLCNHGALFYCLFYSIAVAAAADVDFVVVAAIRHCRTCCCYCCRYYYIVVAADCNL